MIDEDVVCPRCGGISMCSTEGGYLCCHCSEYFTILTMESHQPHIEEKENNVLDNKVPRSNTGK